MSMTRSRSMSRPVRPGKTRRRVSIVTSSQCGEARSSRTSAEPTAPVAPTTMARYSFMGADRISSVSPDAIRRAGSSMRCTGPTTMYAEKRLTAALTAAVQA